MPASKHLTYAENLSDCFEFDYELDFLNFNCLGVKPHHCQQSFLPLSPG